MEAWLSPPLLWPLQRRTSIQYQNQLSPFSFWETSAPCDLIYPRSKEPLTLWPHLSICGPAACCIYGAHHLWWLYAPLQDRQWVAWVVPPQLSLACSHHPKIRPPRPYNALQGLPATDIWLSKAQTVTSWSCSTWEAPNLGGTGPVISFVVWSLF